jgi:site-specific recombinase XerD
MSGTRRKPGRMAPHIGGFRDSLLAAGYTPGTVRGMLKVMGRLGRWMEVNDIGDERVRLDDIEAFCGSLRPRPGGRVPGLRSVEPLVVYLRDVGALEAHKPPPATPVSELLAVYRTWMIDERGLAAATVLRYENAARRFLDERFASAGDQFIADLEAVDVTGFLVAECGRVSLGAAKGRVAELRSLLRFLFLKGWTPRPLGVAIPPVAGWHDTTIPTGIAAGDVERLIASCEPSTVIGARDVAVLLLVARLGLRSAEVARLELDDIDWRVGELVVRGKARRQDRLPLPHDVGEALSGYVGEFRPATATRRVFLTVKAPIQPLRPDRVSDITRRACARVGIVEVGAHRLRHALAAELLRRGGTLVEVGQVLRHRDLATTAVYAKVDLDTLRQVALPWPGGVQ